MFAYKKAFNIDIKKKASNICKKNLKKKSKNRTFGIALVYEYSNKDRSCWYRWPFHIIYQHQFTRTCKKKNHHQEIKKDTCLNA